MRAELTAEEQALLEQARGAAAGAFAPYSRFRVGAALRSADGRVFRGANVESARSATGIAVYHGQYPGASTRYTIATRPHAFTSVAAS